MARAALPGSDTGRGPPTPPSTAEPQVSTVALPSATWAQGSPALHPWSRVGGGRDTCSGLASGHPRRPPSPSTAPARESCRPLRPRRRRSREPPPPASRARGRMPGSRPVLPPASSLTLNKTCLGLSFCISHTVIRTVPDPLPCWARPLSLGFTLASEAW